MNKKILLKTLLFTVSFYGLSLSAEPGDLYGLNLDTPVMGNSQKTKIQKERFPPTLPFLPEESTFKSSGLSLKNKTQEAEEKEFYAFLKGEFQIDTPSNTSHFLELGLEYPVNFGVHLRYFVAKTIYSRLGISFMPKFFLDSFEKLSPALGYLNEEESRLISDTFENSMYLDFRMAWIPYAQEPINQGGPYLELGLSGIFFGSGELKGSHLRKVITAGQFEELKNYSVKTNAYNATIHAGYQIPLDKMKLNVEVGLIKILDAKVLSVKTVNAPLLLSKEQKQKFKKFLREKGWMFPTVSAWISFSF